MWDISLTNIILLVCSLSLNLLSKVFQRTKSFNLKVSCLFFKRETFFFFKRSFRFRTKFRGKYRDSSSIPYPNTCITSPHDQALIRMTLFFKTKDESIEIHSLPEGSFLVLCILYVWSNIWHIHHYIIIQSIFTALKILFSAYSSSHHPLCPATTDLFIAFMVLPFHMSHGWNHTVYYLFSMASFT